MKSSSVAAVNTIARDYAIKVSPRLIAEWEYNRFLAAKVTVTPDQTGNDEWTQWYGDESTIVEPNRPTAGIAKARANDGIVPKSRYPSTTPATRYYPSYEYDTYNYFSSVQKSGTSRQSDGSYLFSTPIQITAMYSDSIAVNKLVLGFELGYCKPVQMIVEITDDGGDNWTRIMTNPAVDAKGLVTYWNAPGGFSTTPNYVTPTVINGVRLTVYSVNKASAHLDLLQISPRLENDLTPYLVSYESDFEVSSPSFIAPLGKASSNQATITLSNIDGRFNNENVNSLYYHLIEKKVRFTMDIGVDTTDQGGSGFEYIREFTMWADSWGAGDTSSNVQVACKDSSVILQERNVPPVYLEKTTVGAIMSEIMDRVGMTNYQFTATDAELAEVIPFYWPSDTSENSNPRWGRLMVSTQPPPNTTIWDEFSALAEATQTAVFFDEYDQLQIKSRAAMYNNNKAVNWSLDAVPNGTKLPDVVSAQSSFDLTCNQVEITYRPCAMSSSANGFPVMATVWTPTSAPDNSIIPNPDNSTASSTDVVLRGSPMVKDLLRTGSDLWIQQNVANIWPWESDVNIEGEVLHYKGKEYAYYDAHNVLRKTIVETQSEQQSYDALNANLSWKNYYTGRFIVTERGMYGSITSDHKVSPDKYTTILTATDNSFYSGLGSGYIIAHNGYMTMKTASKSTKAITLRKHGTAIIPTPGLNTGNKTVWYGTRIRFPSGYTGAPQNPSNVNDKPDLATATANWHSGGIYFAGDNGDAGYYLTITSTGQIDGWENRNRNEISMWGMGSHLGGVLRAGTNGDPKGFKFGILEDVWYDIDVSYTERHSDGHIVIAVFVNGVGAGTWDLDAAHKVIPYTNQWRFGTFVMGPSMGMDVEYLYAIGDDETNPLRSPDETSFLDLVSGGYASGFVAKNVKYNLGANVTPAPTLRSGASLFPGLKVYSANKQFYLILTSAGSFGVFGPNNVLYWSSHTSTVKKVHMHTNGNLLGYDFAGHVVWSSGTSSAGAFLQLQNDGNLVIFDRKRKPIWSTGTAIGPNIGDMVYDEYGPIVHEVRTFDVQFVSNATPAPASFLYLTNPRVDCLSYQSDAFGAEFVLANADRQNAVVNGEDTLTFGIDNSITQAMLVYGQAVYTAQNDSFLTKKDDDAIRRQGLIRTQFTSRYIQTEDMATAIGDWILSLWATGVDQVECELFGNPLLQIGDLVTMNYPTQGMSPDTHQYFVISIKNSFDSGYKTSVTLRRAKITGPTD